MRASDMHKLPLFVGRVKYHSDGTLTCTRTGKPKGNLTASGYLKLEWTRGSKGRVECYLHRFVWYIHNGEIPEGFQVDHINMCKTDNRIENLRLVNADYNNQNRRFKGYSWNVKAQKYKASIWVTGRSIHLGMFDTEEAARAAYLAAKVKYHPGTTQYTIKD